MNLDFRSSALLEGAQVYRTRTHASFGYVCAECRYAQLFAVQPRALCQHRAAQLFGQVLFAGQPACPDFVPQRGVDVRLGAALIGQTSQSPAASRSA